MRDFPQTARKPKQTKANQSRQSLRQRARALTCNRLSLLVSQQRDVNSRKPRKQNNERKREARSLQFAIDKSKPQRAPSDEAWPLVNLSKLVMGPTLPSNGWNCLLQILFDWKQFSYQTSVPRHPAEKRQVYTYIRLQVLFQCH